MACDFECLVVGAGVVGLAIARELAIQGRSVLIVDREKTFGSQTSSRNSEVIHAGIYYPPQSLKARCCVDGKRLLYDFIKQSGVAHRRCGKVVVATDTKQTDRLDQIKERGVQAGVHDIERWSSHRLARRYPELLGKEALFSPSTGIVDSHGLMVALLAQAEQAGAEFVANTEIHRFSRGNTVWQVWLEAEKAPALTVENVILSAGHGSHTLVNRIEGYGRKWQEPRLLAKGNYFGYAGTVPFDSLVYPVPEPGGLGIHLTLDMAGRARFGPDVEWVKTLDYHVAESRHKSFVSAIREYWPTVDADKLYPDYAGIRPKAFSALDAETDFVIEGAEIHGQPGLVVLMGIESPGLTSCLSLAQLAAQAVQS